MCGNCVAICPKEAVSITGYEEQPIKQEGVAHLNPDDVLNTIRFRRSIRQFQKKEVLKDAGIINARREGTKNCYYLSTDDTKWKDFVELVNLIYNGIKCLGEKESHKVNRKDEFEKTLFNRENAK